MADHDCPGGCGGQVPQHQLSCKPCWFRLPKTLRDALNSAYRTRGRWPMAHRQAMAACLAWYRDNPREVSGA